MKLKTITLSLVFILILFTFSACQGNEENQLGYDQITQDAAKEIMDSGKDVVILDVRTPDEFYEGHIENAVLIPDKEISARAEQEIPDKEQLILIYCRSGRRSKLAAAELVKLGYTNVKEFGGIIDWKYETVK